MFHKKYITCQQCGYFPNKADEINQREIKIEPWQIKWRCAACGQENVYAGREVVILPESSLITIGKESILAASMRAKKIIQIIVDLDSFLPAQSYYVPVFKEQIAKSCNISLDCFKSLQDLQKESEWLALYLSFLKGFNKFSKKTIISKDELGQLSYIIYLLDVYVHWLWSNKEGQELKISIISQETVYSFDTSTIDKESKNMFSFLKIYALLQFQESLPWLLNFYKNELQDHKKIKPSISQISQLILIGNNFSEEQDTFKHIFLQNESMFDLDTLRCAKEMRILKSSAQFGDKNVFSINPLGRNAFLHYITRSKCEYNRAILVDSFIVFFRLDKQRKILSLSLKQTEIQVIKREFLLVPNIGKTNENWLKKQLKKQIILKHPNSKVKLIKFYSQLSIKNALKCFLFTFNWAKIQKQLLIEELDEEMEEEHQLKEDILHQNYIKLLAPSPFLKKDRQYFEIERQQRPCQQEDYEYL